MRRKNERKILLSGAIAVLCLLGFSMAVKPTEAASGKVYSCKINPCYSHPVTGEIEDSGGKSSYATGQGMVAGVLSTKGMLEETDDGRYYLTFRMSLMDYTSDQSFKVQKKGASGWSKTAMGVTKEGKDKNGTTADVCVEVPAKDCVVRGTMYVEPMGRSVIFYLYPSKLKLGKPSGMKATMVTKTSSSSNQATSGNTSDGASSGSSTSSSNKSSEKKEATQENTVNDINETEVSAGTDTSAASGTETDEELSSAQGLSLSTASDAVETTESGSEKTGENSNTEGNQSGVMSVGSWVLVLTLSLTLSGLILLGTGAGIVYYFRKNWWRWGYEDDEE